MDFKKYLTILIQEVKFIKGGFMDEKKYALITGGNRGIGFAAARDLGMKGMTVYLGARDGERGEKAVQSLLDGKTDIRLLHLDVTDRESIAGAFEQVNREAGRLDILINNAGITVSPEEQATVEGLRRVYETNVFGLYAVTRAFIPLLEAGRPSKILNISSGLGSLSRLSEPSAGGGSRYNLLAYGSSKTSVNAITAYLGDELKKNGITVLAIAPGFTATGLNNFHGTNSPEYAARIIMKYALDDDEAKTGGFFDEKGQLPW
jgi:NAD(P)-dependent dehydrogenase (short-subunit alcohol dehydrogenase family)